MLASGEQPHPRPLQIGRNDSPHHPGPHRTGPDRDHRRLAPISAQVYAPPPHASRGRPCPAFSAAPAAHPAARSHEPSRSLDPRCAGGLGETVHPRRRRRSPSADPASESAAAGLAPTIHWEDVQAHAKDRITFTPGDRATVGSSRARRSLEGRWRRAPVPCRPDGSMAARCAAKSRPAEPAAPSSGPSTTRSPSPHPSPEPRESLSPRRPPEPTPAPEPNASQPRRLPSIPASTSPLSIRPTSSRLSGRPGPVRPPAGDIDLQARGRSRRPSPPGLRVPALLGGQPARLSIHYDLLSTIAYFSVGSDTTATS